MKTKAILSMAICGLATGLFSCATHKHRDNSPSQVWSWPEALDAVRAASDSHRVLFENDRVRVLEVTIPPHMKEALHTHRWPSVLYVDKGGPFRDFDSQGNVVFDTRTATAPLPKPPVALWSEPQAPHAIENLADEPSHLIRFELKK